MANSLLDFVMSLVRDPEAAARYAADPAQAIADANLTDVTSADVQNLIPVVAESLSMSIPAHGLDAFDDGAGVAAGGNVWASGAATAAFDAFDDHLPEHAVIDTHAAVPDIVGDADPAFAVPEVADLTDAALSPQFEELPIEEPVVTDAGFADDWGQALIDPSHPGEGFDLFD
ncbi:Rv0340 family protein [Mycobacterium sp. Y57]|uniref:Rv0340 family IniB-related protein n=1 Tax=Mycolicibacterium xanthum TaxID=2796469 RepID=UPI001C85E335|nr:Rv0340 family IniB-related protein [Mycolicibacterium xanthum]MBX7431897.1 Rv0340 family protein [Mycolicibacterium xanthum]